MCQGLPCIGHRVKLIRTYRTFTIGLEGVIRQENLEDRSVLVYFESSRQTVWIPEA